MYETTWLPKLPPVPEPLQIAKPPTFVVVASFRLPHIPWFARPKLLPNGAMTPQPGGAALPIVP